MKDLLSIVSHFRLKGTVVEIKPLGAGLINDTYKVTTSEADAPDYVLQRINHAIFQNVEMLQANIGSVTGHIRKKLEEKGESDIERKVLHFVPGADGKTYWHDGESYWRVMTFIPRAKTYETVNPEYSYYAGAAFGNFQAMLADIPDTLGETIPDFHNMEFRLKQLREAVAADAAGRVKEVQYFLDEIEKRADEMCKAERLHREGKLPKRVCHCDTKVNNMMFDEDGT
ncbi:aminoglycoside phosphotransferase family protein, partial [uncultured Bacteroides sp.]